MSRVHRGTPDHYGCSGLCATCSNVQHIRGTSLSEEVTLCHSRGIEPLTIRWKVTHCGDYEDERTPALWQMEKIAWRFSVDDRKKDAPGFVSPVEWRKKHEDDD